MRKDLFLLKIKDINTSVRKYLSALQKKNKQAQASKKEGKKMGGGDGGNFIE